MADTRGDPAVALYVRAAPAPGARRRPRAPGSAARPAGLRGEPPAPPDLEQAAVAVLTVAAALARYLAETRDRAGGTASRLIAQLPGPASLPVRAPAVIGRLLASTRTAAERVVGAVADELVPGVARAVLSRLDLTRLVEQYVDLDRLSGSLDVDAVVARVDIDAVADRVDLERIVHRLDLDGVVARVDLDRAVDRVDIERILARVDLDAIADRVDIERILARVDLDAVADRLDLERIAGRLDLDELVGRVDLDRAVERVDLDRAVDRVDLDRIIARADIVNLARYVVDHLDLPDLLRSSTGSVTSEVVRSVREQSVDADRAVERVVDRLLRRRAPRTAPSPPADGALPDAEH